MDHLFNRQFERALYQAALWALLVIAISKGEDFGLIDGKKLDAITEAAREYYNLYSIGVFFLAGLVMLAAATLIRPWRARVAEIFVEETCGTLGIAFALAGASWLYVFAIGFANSGFAAVYADHRWNTGELAFLFQAMCAYLTLLVVMPISSAWVIRVTARDRHASIKGSPQASL